MRYVFNFAPSTRLFELFGNDYILLFLIRHMYCRRPFISLTINAYGLLNLDCSRIIVSLSVNSSAIKMSNS